MAEMLVVGSILFWAALAIWLVAVWLLTENEHGFIGLLSTIAYAMVLQLAFKVDVAGWLLSHPLAIGIFAVLYLFIGSGWSFWRWFLFVKDKREPYDQMKTEWLSSKGETTFSTIPAHLKEEWVKYIEAGYNRKELCKTPQVRDYKSKVLRWIGYWPISVISWAFNDMIRRFVKIVYNYIHDWLQSIANRVFATVKNDLPPDFNANR